jgi:hypothetical protein
LYHISKGLQVKCFPAPWQAMRRPCALRPFFSFLLYALRPAPFLFFFILPRPGRQGAAEKRRGPQGPLDYHKK